MAGVLDKLKVLDLSWGIAGPMATMLLADNGADVTKIEPPGGDPFRNQLGYKVWQRGKSSAILDLKNADDKEDAFWRWRRPPTCWSNPSRPAPPTSSASTTRRCPQLNPRLIYCSITGYGRDNELQRPSRLRRAGAGAHRPDVRAARLGRRRAQSHQRPAGSVSRISKSRRTGCRARRVRVRCSRPRTGRASARSSPPRSASPRRCARARSPARASGSRPRCCRARWPAPPVSGSARRKSTTPGFDTWILGSRSPKGHFQGKDGKWIHNWVPNPRFILQASQGDTLNASPDLTVQNDPDRFGTGPEEILVMAHYQPILAEAVAKFPAQGMDRRGRDRRDDHAAGAQHRGVAGRSAVPGGRLRGEAKDPELGTIRTVGNAYNMSVTQGKPGAPPVKPGANTAEVKAEAAQDHRARPRPRTAGAAGRER